MVVPVTPSVPRVRTTIRRISPAVSVVVPVPVPLIVALLPAHNEAAGIAASIKALFGQTRVPDRIIVIADACTDDTAGIAAKCGAEVFTTKPHKALKAGALNQTMAWLLPELSDDDQVVVQDADTTLNPAFIASASAALKEHSVGGACARYNSPRGFGLLGLLQRNEFARCRRSISRKGSTFILVGMAAQFRVSTLREVLKLRADGKAPPSPGLYNESSITEDYELTICLRTLGYHLVAPPGCDPLTDVMTTVKDLWHQRIRWYRGSMDDLKRFGWTRTTTPYIGRISFWGLSSLSLIAYPVYMMYALAKYGHLTWSPLFVYMTCTFLSVMILDRCTGCRKQGPLSILFAALLFPELTYELFQSVVFWASLYKHLRKHKAEWISN